MRLQIRRVAREPSGGGRGPYREGFQPHERCGDRLGQAGGEELDLRVGPQHPEREHDEAGDGSDLAPGPGVEQGERLTNVLRHRRRIGVAAAGLFGERALNDAIHRDDVRARRPAAVAENSAARA